jgi:hypothetical protein
MNALKRQNRDTIYDCNSCIATRVGGLAELIDNGKNGRPIALA